MTPSTDWPAVAPPPGAVAIATTVRPRRRRPVEERFGIRVERQAPAGRLQELGVDRWPVWEMGEGVYAWTWRVDELVYIANGTLVVTPATSANDDDDDVAPAAAAAAAAAAAKEDSLRLAAGDVVRFPKWFAADLAFPDPAFEMRYSFRAYGDD
eukprot:SM000067S20328  [mRNA]  locus=s67:367684:368945:- [translate_table: standard]